MRYSRPAARIRKELGPMPRPTILILCVVVSGACGSQGRPTSPTTVENVPAANQPPRIVSAAVAPSLGVSQVTAFTARVEAFDPDGDPMSFSWRSSNRTVASEEQEFTFVPGAGVSAIAPLTLTVTDSKGASANATVDFITAALDWEFDGWVGQAGHGFDFRLSLSQEGRVITGRMYDFRGGHVGATDPAERGRIESDGHFRIRFKLESPSDTTFIGQLVPYQSSSSSPFAFFTRFIAVGRVSGGRFDGQSFTFGYHDSY